MGLLEAVATDEVVVAVVVLLSMFALGFLVGFLRGPRPSSTGRVGDSTCSSLDLDRLVELVRMTSEGRVAEARCDDVTTTAYMAIKSLSGCRGSVVIERDRILCLEDEEARLVYQRSPGEGDD